MDYYCFTNESHAYILAFVLNPWRKWQYIYKHWPEAWYQDTKNMVQKAWEKGYKPIDFTPLKSLFIIYNDFWQELDTKKRVD